MPRSLTLLVLLLVCLCTTPAIAQEAPWPTQGWTTATPASQGINGAPFETLDDGIRNGTYGYIDRMLVVRNGYLVVNERYTNDYRTISKGAKGPLGCGFETCEGDEANDPYNYLHPNIHPYFNGRAVHSLQSVTKSIAATVIGVAIQQGAIDGLEAPLLSFFEDYDLSKVDDRLHEATLFDLLTMRSGIEWHETDRPLDETNTTLQLEHSDDWIQFTLDQPMDAAPGEKWTYNSGGSHLISGIIEDATGQFIDAYAETHFFGPLGITDYHWKKTPKGFPDTEGGLFLEAEQLAKIGYLHLNDGMWDGTRILPEGWSKDATAQHVEGVNNLGWGYGYQWWRLDQNNTEIWAGLGFGGQFFLILPEHNIVGVVNSWNLYGGSQSSILGAFMNALIASTKG